MPGASLPKAGGRVARLAAGRASTHILGETDLGTMARAEVGAGNAWNGSGLAW